eukprot:357202-Chlamydomonas_euryale.AAC.12
MDDDFCAAVQRAHAVVPVVAAVERPAGCRLLRKVFERWARHTGVPTHASATVNTTEPAKPRGSILAAVLAASGLILTQT